MASHSNFAALDDLDYSNWEGLDALSFSELLEGGIAEHSSTNDGSPRQQPSQRGITPEQPVPYTTAYQRRKRQEIKALKAEEERLRKQLSKMLLSQNCYANAETLVRVVAARNSRREWRDRSIVEHREQLRSEDTNQKLKKILAKHLKLVEMMSAMVQTNWRNLEEQSPMVDETSLQIDFTDLVFMELSEKLSRLCLETNAVLPGLGDDVNITLRTQTKQDATGNCYETMVITPMACSAQEAAESLWKYSTVAVEESTTQTFEFVRSRIYQTGDEISSIVTLLVRGKNGESLRVDAVSTFRTHEGGERVVQVGTMSWFVPSEGLRFEDSHWTMVSPSSPGPIRSSVIRTCYQLRKKCIADPKPVSPDEEEIMSQITWRTRKYLQLRQDTFLKRANVVYLI